MKPEQSREWAALALDPARPVRRESKYSEYFVMQDGLPTRPEWRALVPFLALPDACEVKFYCSAGDLVPDQLHMIFADLDPAANRGHRRCQISPAADGESRVIPGTVRRSTARTAGTTGIPAGAIDRRARPADHGRARGHGRQVCAWSLGPDAASRPE